MEMIASALMTQTSITRVTNQQATIMEDVLAVEEPLEIRLVSGSAGNQTNLPLSVTMRTPGHDEELATSLSEHGRKTIEARHTCGHRVDELLAIVADRSTVRLLALPAAKLFADLTAPRPVELTTLAWDASRRHLAAASLDGYIQVWTLGPWQDWIATHHLEK